MPRQRRVIPDNEVDLARRQAALLLDNLGGGSFDNVCPLIVAIANQSAYEDAGKILAAVVRECVDTALLQPNRSERSARLCRALTEGIRRNVHDDACRDSKKHYIEGGRLVRIYLMRKLREEFEMGSDVGHLDGPKKARYLGLFRFVGEILKTQWMHECIELSLEGLRDGIAPHETYVEALYTLLKTAGSVMDNSRARSAHMDVYFERIQRWSNDQCISIRHRRMLDDLIYLRFMDWRASMPIAIDSESVPNADFSRKEDDPGGASPTRSNGGTPSTPGGGVNTSSLLVSEAQASVNGSTNIPSENTLPPPLMPVAKEEPKRVGRRAVPSSMLEDLRARKYSESTVAEKPANTNRLVNAPDIRASNSRVESKTRRPSPLMAGDLSNFGKISKSVPMKFAPSSVFCKEA
ncbi:armadillo-type protein [Mycena galericulata]|nr:armadillo-type protein [Mycena galericulata]